MATVLVTGAAGFVGAAVAGGLLRRGDRVVGVDHRAGAAEKTARLAPLLARGLVLEDADVTAPGRTTELCETHRPSALIHLAAKSGVRASLADARGYVNENLAGMVEVLEAARRTEVAHLVHASSSTVYGDHGSASPPRSADHPRSVYGATKRAAEILAEAYTSLHGLAVTGLRLFTVYGPGARASMAIPGMARALAAGEPVEIYGEGRVRRDFVHLDDVVEAVVRVLDRPPPAGTQRLLDVGTGVSVPLTEVVDGIARHLGVTAVVRAVAGPPTEVLETRADPEPLFALTGFRPSQRLLDGLAGVLSSALQR